MENTKITKRENFENIITVLETVDRTDLADVIRHEIELLDKRAERKKSSESDETKAFKSAILELLTEPMTCGAIAKALDISTQKATPILTKLVADGLVTKEKDKKSFIYKLA